VASVPGTFETSAMTVGGEIAAAQAAFGVIELFELEEGTTMFLLSKYPAAGAGCDDYPDIVHSFCASFWVVLRGVGPRQRVGVLRSG
jgi:hypothetical protein